MQFPLCSERHCKCSSAMMPLNLLPRNEHSAQLGPRLVMSAVKSARLLNFYTLDAEIYF